MIDKSRSVLLVWDLHQALVEYSFNGNEIVNNIKALIEWSHKNNIPVMFTKITPFPKGFEPHNLNSRWNIDFSKMNLVIEPSQQDIVINKNTWSLFVGTNVELMLRNANKDTIIITGIATEIGVETTARHAYALGFIPIIVSDAVSSSDKEAHERALKNLSKFFSIVSTQDIIKE